jgi:hypothetical protein
MALAFIPQVYCAKCHKVVTDVMRLSDNKTRWIRVRCHGQEQKIGFVFSPQERVELWQGE